MISRSRHLVRLCSLYTTSASGSETSEYTDLSDLPTTKANTHYSADAYTKFYHLFVPATQSSRKNTLDDVSETASKNVKSLEEGEYRSFGKYMQFHFNEAAKGNNIEKKWVKT